jgi:citrate synthase
MTAQGDGLRGVVVGESQICDVQPEGNLYYRGYSIHDLADNATFEEVVYLLWRGSLPNCQQFRAFFSELTANRHLPDGVLTLLHNFPRNARSMDAL